MTARFEWSSAIGALVAVGLHATSAHAESTCEVEPAGLRYDDGFDCVRGADGDGTHVRFGGEVRQRYEYTHEPLFGGGPRYDEDVWLQRYALHADIRLGPYFRLFGQLSSAVETGREGGPGPVDENDLELQNAFVDVSVALADDSELTIRAGRQELYYGSGRLVDVREGPNARRTFDAAHFILERSGWRIDAFAARPLVVLPGSFDDEASDEQSLWGIYATGGVDRAPFTRMDLYYLGFQDDAGTFVQGTARERRHSIGARLWGTEGGWDWNWEALYQFGSFGGGDIRAWTLASETGFTFAGRPWRPRLALSVNVASGDEDSSDDDLGTFNPLFPRGNYFSEDSVLGPFNFFNIHPFVTVRPLEAWSLTADVNFFWRFETADGVYAPSGQLIRAPSGSDERFVGSAVSLKSMHEVRDNLAFTAIYTNFFAGGFIRDTGPSEDIDFLQLTVQFKF